VGGESHAPAALSRGEETRLLILREAGWASDPVRGGCGNSGPSPGFDPWPVQPLVKIRVGEKFFYKSMYIYIYIYKTLKSSFSPASNIFYTFYRKFLVALFPLVK